MKVAEAAEHTRRSISFKVLPIIPLVGVTTPSAAIRLCLGSVPANYELGYGIDISKSIQKNPTVFSSWPNVYEAIERPGRGLIPEG
jgi:hypothetical protein